MAVVAPIAAEVRVYQILPISAVLGPEEFSAPAPASAIQEKEKKQAEEIRQKQPAEQPEEIKTIKDMPEFRHTARKMGGRMMGTSQPISREVRQSMYFDYLKGKGVTNPEEYYKQIPWNMSKTDALIFHRNYLAQQNKKSCTTVLFSTITQAPGYLYNGVSSVFKRCRRTS